VFVYDEMHLKQLFIISAMIKRHRIKQFIVLIAILSVPVCAYPQTDSTNGDVESFTLGQCIDYAIKHQPSFNQSLINVRVAKTNNAINLAGWLPQANISGNLIHYNQLPTTFLSDSLGDATIPRRTGVVNTFIPELTVSQTIFNPQLLYAAKSAPLYIKQARQIRDSTQIFLISSISKAFYNLLLTLEQVNVLKEDTARLDRNVTDTYNQYIGGIVDETDYDEAVISLNNSKGQLVQQIENIVPDYATLKQLMGYPPEKQFNVSFDTLQMMQEIGFDTTEQLAFEKRIEYQQLQTNKALQHEVTGYYGLAFLPTVSAFYNNYLQYEDNNASQLFNTSYPYSYFGLSFNIPIFTGFSRLENIHKSRLQEDILNWSEINLRSQIYTEYTTALANYKSNMYNWKMLRDNVTKAKNVYTIVELQYKQGIVAYLSMIVAESNLISAEIGYTNALFQLLSSKIDLEKAMGDITIQ